MSAQKPDPGHLRIMSNRTEQAREGARRVDGKFGTQPVAEVGLADLYSDNRSDPCLAEADWINEHYVQGVEWIHGSNEEARGLNDGAALLRRHLISGSRDGLTSLEAGERYLDQAYPDTYHTDPVYPHVLERVVAERTARFEPGTEIVVKAEGGHHIYTDGVLNATGLPAIVRARGQEEWYQRGVLHRLDGPAHTDAYGKKSFYNDGLLHRADGPAVIKPDGGLEWWTNGQRGNPDPRGPRSVRRVDGEKLRAEYVDPKGNRKFRRVPPRWVVGYRLPGFDHRRDW